MPQPMWVSLTKFIEAIEMRFLIAISVGGPHYCVVHHSIATRVAFTGRMLFPDRTSVTADRRHANFIRNYFLPFLALISSSANTNTE